MKSLVWTGPRQFEMQDNPPLALREGDVLLRVRYAGICGSELSGYLGTNSLRKPPLVMGHEFAGEVVATQGDVREFSIGDVVTANPMVECGQCTKCRIGQPQHCQDREFIGVSVAGAYAEYVRVPARAIRKVSDAVAGTLVEPLACSLRSVRQSGLQIGDAVVVFGAGMIGLFALKVATLAGASTCILVDTNADRLQIGRLFGATHLVNATEQDAVVAIQAIAGGKVPRVIDAVGAPIVRQQAVQVVEKSGTVVFIGLHHDETELPGNTIVRGEISIVGSFGYNNDDFARAHTMLETGVVTYDKTWLDIRPLDQAKEAFDEQIDGPAPFPKIILTPIY